MKLKHQKTSLLNLLNGYKKVNKLVAAERKKKLVKITAKNSLHEYNYLCSLYATVKKEGLAGLEDQKIYFLKKRRQILNKIGKKGFKK